MEIHFTATKIQSLLAENETQYEYIIFLFFLLKYTF